MLAVGIAGASADQVVRDTDPVAGGDRISLRLDHPTPRAQLFAQIAAFVGAELTIRNDPGEVGPLPQADLPVAEALRRAAGPCSLVLHYDRQGEIASILLIGRLGSAAKPTTPAAPEPPADETTPREQRSMALRDIVELSYRDDAPARSELARLAGAAEDPAVRAAAISALAGSGDPRASRTIDEKGFADNEPTVRLQAARSLWQALGTNARPRLTAALAVETDPGVRAGIGEILRAPR
ncbi:MAG TPA: HEAT repeat domain-containing protein [Geminicoccaceae bacterium]|nr:HEAT repeat domain-containing protein [Geminicoccus sp.]HMU49377.1 HEAT repeat domain-containing protein [Geminicoccaceae bacterium]